MPPVAGESPLANPDDADTDRRGAWHSRPAIKAARSADPECWLPGTALAGLLIPLCDATDAPPHLAGHGAGR
jgi:hypothetical protein